MMPAVGAEQDICADCVLHSGLCQRHAFSVLPQRAVNVQWLKLMGEARTEQSKRQRVAKTLPVSEAGKAHQARRLRARTTARSKRGGYFGLARAIAAKRSLDGGY